MSSNGSGLAACLTALGSEPTLAPMRLPAVVLLVTACAASPERPAATPPPAPGPAVDPASLRPQREDPPVQPAAVPPPPAECARYLEPAACAPGPPVAERLANALVIEEPIARDRELACAEAQGAEAAPLVRALRADLAPVACADVLVSAFLEGSSIQPSKVEEQTLLGLHIAGQLARLVDAPPSLAPPFDKAVFLSFFERELKPWLIGQALAIGELSLRGSRLTGYGKAIAAIAASSADLRFVRAARAVPLPIELASDPEVRDTYYGSLDEALEPRKARGRDAALVGLRVLAELGALSDPRIEQARTVLSELYGGSRVAALEELLLPPLPALPRDTVEERLAARLPTFYAGRLLAGTSRATDPRLLRALLERGIPSNLAARLDREPLSPEARFLYAFAELRRGITYFSASAFQKVGALLGPAPKDEAAALVFALARALEQAPKDAAELVLASPRLEGPLGSLEPLDALARGKSPFAPLAEFDAAFLRALAPPEASAPFWDDVADRFARAARAAKAPEHRARAREHEEAARQTAAVLREEPKPQAAPQN